MKKNLKHLLPALFAMALLETSPAQTTAFTYQGRLNDGTNPATGIYDLRFAIYDAAGGGVQQGNAITNTAIAVSNGLFTVTLDFGNQFPGADRWLEIGVRTNGGGAFSTLSPRQALTSTPYAITSGALIGKISAANVPANLITASMMSSNTLTASQIANGAVGSDELADTIALGATNGNGRLDVYRTAANTPAISLIGSSSQISTYGSDGLEQVRLWGVSYGEILLNNSLSNNATAVKLTAQGASGGLLELRNTNGVTRAMLEGENTGGTLTLYQADGGIGVFIDGDSSGAGYISVRGTNGSTRASLDGSDSGGGSLRLYENDGTETVSVTAEGNGSVFVRQGDGSIGAAIYGNNGTGGGGVTVYRDDGGFAGQLTFSGTSGYLGVANSFGSTRVYARGSNPSGSQGGYLGMNASNGVQTITLDAADGLITASTLDVNGLATASTLDVSGLATASRFNAATSTVASVSYGFASDPNTGLFSPGANTVALATAGLERVRITSAGDVGIGTAGNSIDARLHVQADNARVAKFDRYTSDGELVAWARDDSIVGNVTVAGGVVSYNAFTGSHYGWCDEAPAPGTLMSLTGTNQPLLGSSGGELVYGITPSQIPNDPACLGTYFSTTTAGDAGNERPVRLIAAVGNGDLWVVDTGKDILPGDLLIASDVAGCAMVDDPERFPVGHIVGRAAETVEWHRIGNAAEGRRRARISVLFGPFTRGQDERHITNVSADGVMQAAIQGLNQKVEAQRATLEQKETEITELKQRLEKLEQLLEHQLNRGHQ